MAKVLSQQNLLTLYPNPTQPNPEMAPTTEAAIKPTLEFNSRIHYPKWYRAVQTFAVLHYKEVCRRCGLLTAVLTDPQWPLHPINRTPAANPADPDIVTPRPDVALPAAHAANATNAALRIYERQLNTHDACLAGLSTFLGALILSIGPANALLLADPVHGMMLVTCGDVMAMMQLKHGTPQASDISTLKSLLTVPLKHLHGFSAHLSTFNENLADLEFFAQPIQPHDQFTTFLQSTSNHPAVASRVTMYFSTNPNIATHTIASLTTYLTEQLPHMITITSPTHLGATMSQTSSHVGLPPISSPPRRHCQPPPPAHFPARPTGCGSELKTFEIQSPQAGSGSTCQPLQSPTPQPPSQSLTATPKPPCQCRQRWVGRTMPRVRAIALATVFSLLSISLLSNLSMIQNNAAVSSPPNYPQTKIAVMKPPKVVFTRGHGEKKLASYLFPKAAAMAHRTSKKCADADVRTSLMIVDWPNPTCCEYKGRKLTLNGESHAQLPGLFP